MERRQLLALGGVGFSAAAVTGWVTVGQADQAGTTPDPPADVIAQHEQQTLTVDGTGTVTTDPDQAELSVTIAATDSDDADAVVTELAQRSEQLLDDLTAAGVDEESITTAQYSLRENSREEQYEGAHRYDITLDDHDRAGEIIDVAGESTADEINRVRFTLSTERREDLYEDAVDEAAANARDEAQLYADATGVRLADPIDIETTQTSVSPHEQRTDLALETADDAPTEIESGDVTVTASVTITYRVTAEED